jgi:hypothetical protein
MTLGLRTVLRARLAVQLELAVMYSARITAARKAADCQMGGCVYLMAGRRVAQRKKRHRRTILILRGRLNMPYGIQQFTSLIFSGIRKPVDEINCASMVLAVKFFRAKVTSNWS